MRLASDSWMLMITGSFFDRLRRADFGEGGAHGTEHVCRYNGRNSDRSMFKELLGEAASRAS
jgi:hypothetical protein